MIFQSGGTVAICIQMFKTYRVLHLDTHVSRRRQDVVQQQCDTATTVLQIITIELRHRQDLFWLAQNTISKTIPETCVIITLEMGDEVMQCPCKPENTFGILSHWFRCLLTTMQQLPHRVESIVMACSVMQNLLVMRYPRQTARMIDMEHPKTHEVLSGTWRDDRILLTLQTQCRNFCQGGQDSE